MHDFVLWTMQAFYMFIRPKTHHRSEESLAQLSPYVAPFLCCQNDIASSKMSLPGENMRRSLVWFVQKVLGNCKFRLAASCHNCQKCRLLRFSKRRKFVLICAFVTNNKKTDLLCLFAVKEHFKNQYVSCKLSFTVNWNWQNLVYASQHQHAGTQECKNPQMYLRSGVKLSFFLWL